MRVELKEPRIGVIGVRNRLLRLLSGFKWHFDQRKGILVRVSGEFELLFEFELTE